MPGTDFVVHNIKQLVTLQGSEKPRRGAEMSELSVIENGALAVSGGIIKAVGEEQAILDEHPEFKRVDAGGAVVLPGFVDPHTHLLKDTQIGIAAGQQLALENGITTLTEMTTPQWFLEELQDFAAADQLRVRVTTYLEYSNPCGEVSDPWALYFRPERSFGDNG